MGWVSADFRGFSADVQLPEHPLEVESAGGIDEYLAGIDRPYTFGGPTLRRARIAAVLGEQERAVNLLRDAFTRGTNYGIGLHRDPELASLRNYPPFQELLRPKG